MRIVSISDTHSLIPLYNIPEGDILIHCGDLTNVGSIFEFVRFIKWFNSFNHPYKICIAGNHDIGLEKQRQLSEQMFKESGIIYLRDSSIEIGKLKFYGSPWTPKFFNWAFMLCNDEVSKITRDNIPDDVNVLVTHGPPHGILDFIKSKTNKNHLGCKFLLERILNLNNLKLHLFGHIHDSYGYCKIKNVLFANCSVCTEQYKPTNFPIVIDYDEKKKLFSIVKI